MKWRKKPVVIEAIQWQASKITWDEILAMGCPTKPGEMGSESFLIPTLEGDMKVSFGDWVIKGVNGEFYPCKPDIFAKTYPLADESTPCPECQEKDREIVRLKAAMTRISQMNAGKSWDDIIDKMRKIATDCLYNNL